jgi:hypothetical protein
MTQQRPFEPGEHHRIVLEHYAVTLERIAQSMQARARREDVEVLSEAHGFDLEAMDQYADQVRAVRCMIQMENRK